MTEVELGKEEATVYSRQTFVPPEKGEITQLYTPVEKPELKTMKQISKSLGGDFKYNYQVLALIFPSTFPMISYIGKYTMFIIAFGFMGTYVFSFFRRSKYSFFSFFGTIILLILSLYVQLFRFVTESYFSSSFKVFDLLVLLDVFFFLFVCVLYGSLHFTWFRKNNKVALVWFEKLIFSILPFSCVPLIVTSLTEFVGSSLNSAFYLCFVLYLVIHLLGGPDESSFQIIDTSPRKNAKDDEFFNVVQSKVTSGVLVGICYLVPVPFYYLIFQADARNGLFVWNFFHVVNIVTLVAMNNIFFMYHPKRYLWMIPKFTILFNRFTRALLICANLMIVIIWVEYRVIFLRYPHFFRFPAPYNYLLFNAGVVGFLVILFFLLVRKKETKISYAAYFFVIVVISCAVGILSTLFGFRVVAIPLCSCVAFSFMDFLYTKSWINFSIFVFFSSLIFMGWLFVNFGFIEYEFVFRVLPIEWTININHLCSFVVAEYVLTMFLILLAKRDRIEVLTPVVFVLQAVGLSIVEELLYEQSEGLYSEALILFTTVLGVAIVHKMGEKLRFTSANIVLAVYLSKVVFLFQNGRTTKLLSSFLFFFLVSRVWLIHHRREKISETHAWVILVLNGAGLLLIKNVVTYGIMFFQTMSLSRMLGVFLFSWGAVSSPLFYVMKGSGDVQKRIVLLLMLCGGVWGFLEPLLQIEEDKKDFVIPWLLLAALVYLFGLIFKIFALPKRIVAKIVAFFFISISLGISLTQTSLHFCFYHVDVLVVVMFCMCSLVLVTGHFSKSKRTAVILYYLFLVPIPILYFTSAVNIIPRLSKNLVLGRAALATQARITSLGIAVILNLFIGVLMKFKCDGNPLIVDTRVRKKTKDSKNEDLLFIVKLATVVSYGLAVLLTLSFGGGSVNLSVLLLSIILLLLPTKKKYIIFILTVQFKLFVFTISELLTNAHENFVDGYTWMAILMFLSLKTMASFMLTPAHFHIDFVFMNLKKPNAILPIVSLTLSIFVFLVSNDLSLIYSSVVGVLESIVVLFLAVQWKRRKGISADNIFLEKPRE